MWMIMVYTTYNQTEETINKLPCLTGKTKLKFYKDKSKYYDNMNIRMDENPFVQNAQSISKVYHEILKLMKFLQTKPQVKNMNLTYYDFYSTVNKKRDDREIVNNKHEDDEFFLFLMIA